MATINRALINTEFRALLSRAGLRQAEFARLAGVSTRQVNRWCKGEAALPVWAVGYAAALAQTSVETLQLLTSAEAFSWADVLGVSAVSPDEDVTRAAYQKLAVRYPSGVAGTAEAERRERLDRAWVEAQVHFQVSVQGLGWSG